MATSAVSLPGESHGQRGLAGYSPWGSQRVGHDRVTNEPKGLSGCESEVVGTVAEGAGRSPLLQREPLALLFCSALEGLDGSHSPGQGGSSRSISSKAHLFQKQAPNHTGYLRAPEPSGLTHKTNRHRLLALPPTGCEDFPSLSLLAGKQGPDNTALQAGSLCNERDGDFVGDSHCESAVKSSTE